MDFDLIVIGSGPAGYHAAIRAGQLGLKTAVVERAAVGGVCLNVGCIPTKALLHASSVAREAQAANEFGLGFGDMQVEAGKLMEWKDSVVGKLTGGVRQLFKGNKVELIEGDASFVDRNTIKVGDKNYSATSFIVATGSSPMEVPGFEFDGETVVDSTGALQMSEVPKRFLAIGGSAIGLEFADIYNSLGSQVTVVEMMDRIVPSADPDASRALHRALGKRGIEILTGARAAGMKRTDEGVVVTVEVDGESREITVDKLLVAVGRRPNGKSLGLEAAGVEVDERGFIPTSETMQTNVPNIYAVGDVTKPPLLAHKGMKEGLVAAEHAAGKPAAYDTVVPSVIYTSPELASVGMTEEEAREAGYEVRVGTFPMAASGRALSLEAPDGMAKVIGDAETDLLLGFHMVGPSAGEICAEAALAIEMGATLEDIALTQHPHPTMSEVIMEAAEHAHGRAIHIGNRRR